MSGSYTVSGASIAALVRFCAARGADLSGFVGELGLSLVELAKPESRVLASANDRIWARAAEVLRDPDLGMHFAEKIDLDAFHLVGHLATTAGTFGAALDRIVAFSRLLHDAGRTEIEREGAVARFYPGCRGLPAPPPRHVAEFNATSVVALGRLVTGAPWVPREVHFEHAAPASVREHVRIFGVAPRFSAPETFVVIDAATLALPVRAGGSQIGLYLEAYAKELLTRLPEADTSLRAQVERALAVGVTHGLPEIGAIAAQLHMTPRTLQRRLADEGTSFAELSDAVRRHSAERYLRDGRLPLAEVAYLVGFSDPSNFHKAFRRWTGQTPGAFRERALAG